MGEALTARLESAENLAPKTDVVPVDFGKFEQAGAKEQADYTSHKAVEQKEFAKFAAEFEKNLFHIGGATTDLAAPAKLQNSEAKNLKVPPQMEDVMLLALPAAGASRAGGTLAGREVPRIIQWLKGIFRGGKTEVVAQVLKSETSSTAPSLVEKGLKTGDTPVGLGVEILSDIEKMTPAEAIAEFEKVTKSFEKLSQFSPRQKEIFVNQQLKNLEHFVKYLENLKTKSGVRIDMTDANTKRFGEKLRTETVKIVDILKKNQAKLNQQQKTKFLQAQEKLNTIHFN